MSQVKRDGDFASGRKMWFKGPWSLPKHLREFYRHGAIALMATDLGSIDLCQPGRGTSAFPSKGKIVQTGSE